MMLRGRALLLALEVLVFVQGLPSTAFLHPSGFQGLKQPSVESLRDLGLRTATKQSRPGGQGSWGKGLSSPIHSITQLPGAPVPLSLSSFHHPEAVPGMGQRQKRADQKRNIGVVGLRNPGINGFRGLVGGGLRGSRSTTSLKPEMSTKSVHIVIPALNEAKLLGQSLNTLTQFLSKQLTWDWRVTVVDNGSEDQTYKVANQACQACPDRMKVIQVPERGRGRALKVAWSGDGSQVQCYMDVDLSTDLEALPEIVEAVAQGSCDIAIASRGVKGAVVRGRSLVRSLTSWGYRVLLRILFLRSGIRDFQCGCKALSREMVARVLPEVKNGGWFFDTEMLLLASGSGYKVLEVPAQWQDDRDSRVKVASTILEMLRGVYRLKAEGWRGRLKASERVWKVEKTSLAQLVLRGWGWGRRLLGSVLVAWLKAVRRFSRAVTLIVRYSVVRPALKITNSILFAIAKILPEVKSPIANERLFRVGFMKSMEIPELVDRDLPGFAYGTERVARLALSSLPDDTLFGMVAIASGELVSREVQRQIDPLPEPVQDKAYKLIDRVVDLLEEKIVALSNAGWSVELFLNQEIKYILGDPWNRIPLLQEPEVRDTVLLVVQALAQIEAQKVLKAIGLNQKQSLMFLELDRVLGSARSEAGPTNGTALTGRNFYESLFGRDVDSIFKKFDRNKDGVISWEDLWVALYGSTIEAPEALSYLSSVNATVALSPQLNLLLETRQTGSTAAITGKIDEDLARSLQKVDRLFNVAVDSIEARLGKTMRKIYYTEEGISKGNETVKAQDHLLGNLERRLARPVFVTLFQLVRQSRTTWSSGMRYVDGVRSRVLRPGLRQNSTNASISEDLEDKPEDSS